MRDLSLVEPFRQPDAERRYYGVPGNESCGFFLIPSPIDHAEMAVIASAGEDWDHVSVSRRNRPPNWLEMDYIKRLFFRDDEVAMQLHIPPAENISLHPHCLHLWRPQKVAIPRPPSWMVGPSSHPEKKDASE